MPDKKRKIRALGMPKLTQSEWIDKLANSQYAAKDIDYYNQGELVTLLEERVAARVGKPSALFFSKGMMAQLAALKTATEAQKCPSIILHPQSHIAWDEQDAYQALFGMKGILLGEHNTPFTTQQIQSVTEPVAALTVELPLRRAGFKLTPLDELLSMQRWCREHNVHFHLDGARIWESTYYYQKSEAEIAAHFDTVYVSLYKGLGGMGGSILAGEEDFIEQCKVWRSRFCGDHFTMFPMIITALDGLDHQLEQIPSMVIRAQEIATMLNQFDELSIEVPQTNGFFVYLDGDAEQLSDKAKQLTLATGISLFSIINQLENAKQKRVMIELQVGAEHQAITDQEIKNYFSKLLN